ncbi:hypothetical protein T265_06224 [Opisthorchis viverrini]|uniref:Uncharacterized protein n=1 Tax=Opisthorchis viverrini TaxID=6198 RepID=A0A074ZH25_OPIVI|nr:hypothetical protein T265_06224 [Opisthorchis viverrini]KER26581.1 hypothetical protein T265_06224 [Opisthorchis viverrini]
MRSLRRSNPELGVWTLKFPSHRGFNQTQRRVVGTLTGNESSFMDRTKLLIRLMNTLRQPTTGSALLGAVLETYVEPRLDYFRDVQSFAHQLGFHERLN